LVSVHQACKLNKGNLPAFVASQQLDLCWAWLFFFESVAPNDCSNMAHK
jgi:hypothetical protein